MKIDRITIMVEAPAGVVDREKLLGLVKAELYGSMPGVPHQAQSWLEPSPNTRIGDAIERPTTNDQYEAEALRPCEKCNRPMNEHDRWNRCPVNCETCGIALKLHGAPGSGCPGRMANYLAQSARAKQWLDEVTAQLLAEGYTENAAGELISPDGRTVVDLD
jgi:hypothetical protein